MFRYHTGQRERFGRVSGHKRIVTTKWFKIVGAFAIRRPRTTDEIFRCVHDDAGTNRSCCDAIEGRRFRARIFKNFAPKIEGADNSNRIFVSKRLHIVKNIGERIRARVSNRAPDVLVENHYDSDAGAERAESYPIARVPTAW